MISRTVPVGYGSLQKNRSMTRASNQHDPRGAASEVAENLQPVGEFVLDSRALGTLEAANGSLNQAFELLG